ncbi:N-acetyltransferase [Imperialibacter roseus]|uniref:N-acetyltransferase n=1 Tax=Imperialibacter roseus TaxID=1324217 RepID=A0ABZ0IT65_9BACT|nr:N-acetyltransferase [Imperialibacter roseus]WOK07334.1 N-acetyltransferase [Imperialibacter roseus]
MVVIDTGTGASHKVEIEPVEDRDFASLTKARYFFDWKQEKEFEMYKLRIANTRDILGLVSVERIPEEWMLHIRLLTVSKENKGSSKKFENIAGNLLTFVSKIAVREYGELACVSLKPKGLIARHYIDKFGMNVTGLTLSIEILEIFNLIETYDHD